MPNTPKLPKLNRRGFLALAGAGALAGAAIPAVGAITASNKSGLLSFRAVAGLPHDPLPTYCSYVIEGHINVNDKSGTFTETMYAGAPDAMSLQVWAGLTRNVRVTDARREGSVVVVSGVVTDRSQLRKHESANVTLRVDTKAQSLGTAFFGYPLTLAITR